MARATYVPINGEVLTWAMRQAGVDNTALAERCKTTPDVVQAWRDGDEQPKKTEFRSLVARLRRPAAIYFLPEPPGDDPVIRAFRGPAGSAGRRDLLDEELRAIQTAERLQRVARWVRESREDAAIAIPQVASASNFTDALREAHAYLDWRASDQFTAGSPSEVARLLRRRLESVGILVLQFPMTRDGCRGFSLHDQLAPVIAVNSAYTTEARIFSYVHEYAHLARSADSICARIPDTNIERRCESFASAFLMPRAPFERYIDQTFGKNAVISSTSDVSRIAKRFKVSLRATAYRLERLDRAATGLYRQVEAEAEIKGAGGFSRDNGAPGVRLREWGTGYAELLFDAERRGLLGRTDLLEYMNVSNRELTEIRSRVEVANGAEG